MVILFDNISLGHEHKKNILISDTKLALNMKGCYTIQLIVFYVVTKFILQIMEGINNKPIVSTWIVVIYK